MRQSIRVILNAAASFAQQAINMGLQVFLLAFILRRISDREYGVFQLALTIQGMVWLLRDAILKACINEVAAARERDDLARINRVISTSSLMLLGPGLLALAAVLLLGGPAADFFGLQGSLHATMKGVMFLAGLSVLLVLPLCPFGAVIQAAQRYGLLSWVTALFRLLRAAVIVALFIWVRADVLYVMLATVISDVGIQVALMLLGLRVQPGLRLFPRHFDKAVLAAVAAFGSYLLAAGVTYVLGSELTKWVIGKMLDLNFVTALTVSVYLLAIVRAVVQTMTMVLVPVAGRFKALGDESALREMFLRGTRYSCLAAAMAVAPLIPVMGPLLGLWLRPDLAWIGPFAAAAGVCGVFCVPADCAQQILNGLGESRRPFWVTFWAAAGSLLALVGGLAIGGGFTAAVVSLCIGMAIFGLGMTAMAVRVIHVPLGVLAYQAYVQPALAMIPAAGMSALVAWRVPPAHWPALLLACLAGLAAYVAGFLPFVSAAEWALVRGAVGRLRGRLG